MTSMKQIDFHIEKGVSTTPQEGDITQDPRTEMSIIVEIDQDLEIDVITEMMARKILVSLIEVQREMCL